MFGGGACQALAGVLVFDACEINDNVANEGGAFEIARQALGAQTVPTIVYVANSVIARNTVLTQGAAFNLASCQQVVFQNVTFLNNSGAATVLHVCFGAPSVCVYDMAVQRIPAWACLQASHAVP